MTSAPRGEEECSLASAHLSYDLKSRLPPSRWFLKLPKAEVYREPAGNFQNDCDHKKRREILVQSQSKLKQCNAHVFGGSDVK
jgi:hypothetical protein